MALRSGTVADAVVISEGRGGDGVERGGDAMSRKGKKRLIFLGCLALAGGFLAWWTWPPKPKVSFLEFRGSGAERVAVFALENDTSTHFSYETDAETREMILGFRIRQDNEWKTLDPHKIMPTPN